MGIIAQCLKQDRHVVDGFNISFSYQHSRLMNDLTGAESLKGPVMGPDVDPDLMGQLSNEDSSSFFYSLCQSRCTFGCKILIDLRAD